MVLHCAPMANLELAKNQIPDGSLKYSSGILQHRYSPKSSKVSTLRYHVCDIILYIFFIIYIYIYVCVCACACVCVCDILYNHRFSKNNQNQSSADASWCCQADCKIPSRNLDVGQRDVRNWAGYRQQWKILEGRQKKRLG